jgi:hypothetical protein
MGGRLRRTRLEPASTSQDGNTNALNKIIPNASPFHPANTDRASPQIRARYATSRQQLENLSCSRLLNPPQADALAKA